MLVNKPNDLVNLMDGNAQDSMDDRLAVFCILRLYVRRRLGTYH